MNDVLAVVLLFVVAVGLMAWPIHLGCERARAWRAWAEPRGHTVYTRPPRVARRGYNTCRIRTWGNEPDTTIAMHSGGAVVWLSRVEVGPGTRGTGPLPSLAVLAQTGTRQLPSMSIHPRTVLERLATMFGGSDIRVEGDDTFSAMYRVAGRDDREVRRFLAPELRAWFCGHAGKASMEARAGYVMLFVRGADPRPDELGAWSEALTAPLRALGVLEG